MQPARWQQGTAHDGISRATAGTDRRLPRRSCCCWLFLPACLPAAILFHSIQTSGAFEKRSMHGSCPVIQGGGGGKIKHKPVLCRAVPCCCQPGSRAPRKVLRCISFTHSSECSRHRHHSASMLHPHMPLCCRCCKTLNPDLMPRAPTPPPPHTHQAQSGRWPSGSMWATMQSVRRRGPAPSCRPRTLRQCHRRRWGARTWRPTAMPGR